MKDGSVYEDETRDRSPSPPCRLFLNLSSYAGDISLSIPPFPSDDKTVHATTRLDRVMALRAPVGIAIDAVSSGSRLQTYSWKRLPSCDSWKERSRIIACRKWKRGPESEWLGSQSPAWCAIFFLRMLELPRS